MTGGWTWLENLGDGQCPVRPWHTPYDDTSYCSNIYFQWRHRSYVVPDNPKKASAWYNNNVCEHMMMVVMVVMVVMSVMVVMVVMAVMVVMLVVVFINYLMSIMEMETIKYCSSLKE